MRNAYASDLFLKILSFLGIVLKKMVNNYIYITPKRLPVQETGAVANSPLSILHSTLYNLHSTLYILHFLFIKVLFKRGELILLSYAPFPPCLQKAEAVAHELGEGSGDG